MRASLEEVLRYEHEDVVHRFAEDYDVNVEDAREVFVELMKWLWLSATQIANVRAGGTDVPIPLFGEARAIDLMWHTFLLFTADYMQFCETYFGFYVHHKPRTRAEKLAWDERVLANAEDALAERRSTLRAAYVTICDYLGEATLRTWCEEFPARFPMLR